MLNCISSRDHSSSEKLCRALMDKLKINQNPSDNSSLEVKRKILQIMPVFLHKNKDAQIWEDLLGLLRLYDPPCHDHSEEGFHLLLSLIEAVGSISYNRVFHYYFEKFHRILLTLSKVHECRSPQH